MKEIEVVKLEGIEYMIIKELIINGVTYIHLAKVESPEEFCIRKIQIIDKEEMIVGLDNKEEFDMALEVFNNNHKEELEN
jgi:hypothetical protein